MSKKIISKESDGSGILKPSDVKPHLDKLRGYTEDVGELIPNCIEVRHILHFIKCIEDKLERGALKAILK